MKKDGLFWLLLLLWAVVPCARGDVAPATLVSFNGANGANPLASLVQGTDGNFYGTTDLGGSAGYGTVFRMTTNGTLTTLVAFNSSNGAYPQAALTLGNDGNFYGTTEQGGGVLFGTVFKMTAAGALTTLVAFNYGNGSHPYAALTPGNDGNFYGTTQQGGSAGYGTVFKVTTNGALTTLAAFNLNNGANPYAALTLGKDGNFYGTTDQGGSAGYGTVFKMTTNGTLTTLVAFNSSNGAYPEAALTLGNDGNFYGTTQQGGSAGYGTVFRMTTNGTLTTLVAFNSSNGADPMAALTLGNDGNFYGTTDLGGSAGYGTVFRMTTNGTLTTLVAFNSSNGANPMAALTVGHDGHFYGTTYGGGSSNLGLVFRLLFPPEITVQPHSQIANAGSNVTFLVSATSLTPLSYRWQKNGTNLVDGGKVSGATTNTLRITGISDSDAGTYSVVLTNSDGRVTSSNATLTVIDPPVIAAQPANLLVLPGTNAVFGVSVAGTVPFGYQWRFNGTNLLNATNALYSIPSVGTNHAGNYSVVITNAAGGATSSNAALGVVLSPQSRTNYGNSTATFAVTAFSPESLNYQWQRNGTNLVEGGRLSGTTSNTLTITSVSGVDAANYRAVVRDGTSSVTSSNATLTVLDPVITAQPTNLLVLLGTNAAFGVSVTGTPPFGYQWQFNGTNLPGATSAIYAIPSVGTNDAGNYSVAVNNAAGSATSAIAALTVVLSPQSQTNYASSTATFTATAFSPESLHYQWQKNGTNLVEGGRLAGTTNNTLTITSVSDADAADYRAVVSDASGSVTTSNALLTVNDFPFIVSQPQSQIVGVGSNVTFNVTAYGAAPFVFHWYFNGTPQGSPSTGTNVSSYALTNVRPNQAGNYSVLVVNGYGSVLSSNAVLTVNVFPPSITAQPTNLLVLMGANPAFGVSVAGIPPFEYQWQFNGINLPNATNAFYSIPSVGADQAGNYSVVITNAAGSATSSNAALTVVMSPQSRTNYGTSTATFTAKAFSPESLNYQWQRNGTNLVEGGRLSGTTNFMLTITDVSSADAANYRAVVSDRTSSVTTSNATLTVLDPGITAQPANVVVLLGTNVAFAVSVAGTAPFGYQWRFNGTNLLDATNALYAILSVGTNDAGNYSVVITNAVGSTTSANAALAVVLSPESQTNYAGSMATFTATAFSPEPLNYQWQENGTNLVEGGRLSGTTNRTLTIASVSDADAANYRAVVSDGISSVTTSNALLKVDDSLSIASQPQSQTAGVGSTVTFNVTVYGAAPFVFQWYFNGTPLGLPGTGTNVLSYTLANVGFNQAGNYTVVLTNGYGSLTSSNALLTVIIVPTLDLQFWAGYPLLSLDGMLGSNFVVQYSTNVAGTNWNHLLSLTNLPASPYLFLDSGGVGQPARFYRAFMQ